jgi:hypothetical protein
MLIQDAMKRALLPAIFLIHATLHAYAAETPGQLLVRMRRQVSDNQVRLPNYTCLETIERSLKAPRAPRFARHDRVRLEVALVNGKELFAWPGSAEFTDREIRDLAPGAAIGNGSFALSTRAVLLGASGLAYQEEVQVNGRRALRYEYDVPLARSRFSLRSGREEAVVAYRGSVWLDPETGFPIRLSLSAYDIPERLNIATHIDLIHYQVVPIGGQPFLLPEAGELRMGDFRGIEHYNLTRFSGCREYGAQSTIRFDVPEDGAEATAVAQDLARDLPAGLRVELNLETKLTWEACAVGDRITASVLHDVRVNKKVVLPRRTKLDGRVIACERQPGPPEQFWLGFEFDHLEGRLAEVGSPLNRSAPRPVRAGGGGASPFAVIQDAHPSGQNLFVVYNEPRFTGILRLVWETGGLLNPVRK